MIVLDTDVVSEPLRPRPDGRVLAWLAAHGTEAALTTITVAELFHGVARLPVGRRRDRLHEAVDELVRSAGDRVLDFDQAAAREHADLRAVRDAEGRPVTSEDAMIAGICRAGGHALATRNTADFAGSSLRVVDPWLADA